MIDLMKVREALVVLLDHNLLYHGENHNTVELCRAEIFALDSHLALSEYDRAVEALAPYLPEGWVACDETGAGIFAKGNLYVRRCTKSKGVNGPTLDGVSITLGQDTMYMNLNLPIPSNPIASLRRIVSTPTGNVVERPTTQEEA